MKLLTLESSGEKLRWNGSTTHDMVCVAKLFKQLAKKAKSTKSRMLSD